MTLSFCPSIGRGIGALVTPPPRLFPFVLWNDIKRLGLIVLKDGGFVAVGIPGTAKKAPDEWLSERKEDDLETEKATRPGPDMQTEAVSTIS